MGLTALIPACQPATPTPSASPTPIPPDADCGGNHAISLINTAPPDDATTRELRDMGILAAGTPSPGLIPLKAPVINAPKYDPNPGYVSWGTTNWTISERVEFPQTGYPSQVWYRINYGWIPARYDGRSYTAGNDPCNGLVPTPATLTFTYDRQAAANYAIEHSYQNASLVGTTGYPSRTGRVTLRFGTGDNQSGIFIPYADFNYTTTFQQPGATGSAMFISEALWAGGLPMTVNYPNDNPPLTNSDCNPNAVANMGWRICAAQRLASNPWDNHEELTAYYTTYQGATLGNNFLVVNGSNTKGKKFSFPGPQTSKSSLYIDGGRNTQPGAPNTNHDLQSYILDLTTGVVDQNASSGLSSYVATTLLGCCTNPTLRMGDYVYLDIAVGSHGLLVVGWQKADSCAQVLPPLKRWKIQDFAQTYQEALSRQIPNPVPYVADFAELYYPTPRPFYCTAYIAPNTPRFFNSHNWYFFTMPDYTQTAPLTLPLSRVYVDPTWSW